MVIETCMNTERNIETKKAILEKIKEYETIVFQDDDIAKWHSEEGSENKSKRSWTIVW